MSASTSPFALTSTSGERIKYQSTIEISTYTLMPQWYPLWVHHQILCQKFVGYWGELQPTEQDISSVTSRQIMEKEHLRKRVYRPMPLTILNIMWRPSIFSKSSQILKRSISLGKNSCCIEIRIISKQSHGLKVAEWLI